MRTISFTKGVLNVTICNLCPSLTLTYPIYYSNGTTFHEPHNQQIDTGTTIEASFGADPKQYRFKGIMLYKPQRKHTIIADNQSNSTASINDTNLYLLVVWDVKADDRKFRVCLIEYTDGPTLDEAELWSLYIRYNNQFFEDYIPNVVTWLIYDDVVVKTRFEVTYGSDYKLDVIISEETGSYNVESPVEIDLKRSVLLLLTLIVLMYAVSSCIQPSLELNIYNQCLNVDLVSPTYITDRMSECHRPPSPKVCAGSIMRSGFIIFDWCSVSGTTLIYRLQMKQPHESTEIDKSTSNAIYILITWRLFSESKSLYVDVLLVEHDKGFDKDNLEKLYYENLDRFRMCLDSATETWLLNDNTALMTTFKVMNGGQRLNVAIFEAERDNDTRTLAHIDPER
jgi:hypothetical protein